MQMVTSISLPVETSSKMSAIGAGICTRDRWDDLAGTLARLVGYDSPPLREIIVIDDGSLEPCPEELKAHFAQVRFLRSEESQGLPAQRNRLAELLEETCAYYLCVDDDSFPVAGSLLAAREYLQANPAVFCLAFHVVGSESESGPGPDAPPHRVRTFVGCAHLIVLEKFRALGGYRKELIFFHEEEEVSTRAWKRGWPIMYFPAVTICHLRRPGQSHRQSGRRAFFFARSKMLVTLWSVPGPVLGFHIAGTVVGCLRAMKARNFWHSLTGSVRGLWDGIFLMRYRDSLPPAVFREYRQALWPPGR